MATVIAWTLIPCNFVFAALSLYNGDWKWALISGGVGAFALVTEMIISE